LDAEEVEKVEEWGKALDDVSLWWGTWALGR
jgi:hypothetical protein